jgi:hypothetical protein
MSVLQQYAKSAVAAIVAALGVAGTVAADGHVSLSDGIGIAATFFAALGSVAVVKNVLTPQQLMAQPNYSPAVSHVPMPLTQNSTGQGHNVDWTPVGLGAPAVHLPRRDSHGRFLGKSEK